VAAAAAAAALPAAQIQQHTAAKSKPSRRLLDRYAERHMRSAHRAHLVAQHQALVDNLHCIALAISFVPAQHDCAEAAIAKPLYEIKVGNRYLQPAQQMRTALSSTAQATAKD
jgi:hypothetical protein